MLLGYCRFFPTLDQLAGRMQSHAKSCQVNAFCLLINVFSNQMFISLQNENEGSLMLYADFCSAKMTIQDWTRIRIHNFWFTYMVNQNFLSRNRRKAIDPHIQNN